MQKDKNDTRYPNESNQFWIVRTALNESGAGLNLSDQNTFETKVEDFLRDHRFNEKDTVRLRPGWRLLSPIIMREMSRS